MNTREQFGDFNTFVKIVNNSITEFEDDTLKFVGARSFYKCNNLTKVILPAAETFSDYTFGYCPALVDISIPSAIDFDSRTFYSCNSLLKIVLPKANKVPFMMCSGCQSLTSVRLPVVTEIGSSAFSNCSNLTSLIIETPNQVAKLTNKDAFSSDNNCIVYVPDALVDSYKEATNWSTLAAKIKPLSELPAEE